jgi:hypothetical protein
MAEHFKIVGTIPVCVHGLAPRRAFHNILEYNWRMPPVAVDRVSYVYISGDEKAVRLADLYGAKLREPHVYTHRCASICGLSVGYLWVICVVSVGYLWGICGVSVGISQS